ncbi:hypothetical protein IWQ61_008835 [Dispira simplex]|nr:hypothetical protein IWQ61_008835 [Dispira simplex]
MKSIPRIHFKTSGLPSFGRQDTSNSASSSTEGFPSPESKKNEGRRFWGLREARSPPRTPHPMFSNGIQDIGRPTEVHHGVHIEIDMDTGKYLGVPDVWQDNFPMGEVDQTMDTTNLNPVLLPTSAATSDRYVKAWEAQAIGLPYNFRHNIHVNFENVGFVYDQLPTEWKELLDRFRARKDSSSISSSTDRSGLRGGADTRPSTSYNPSRSSSRSVAIQQSRVPTEKGPTLRDSDSSARSPGGLSPTSKSAALASSLSNSTSSATGVSHDSNAIPPINNPSPLVTPFDLTNNRSCSSVTTTASSLQVLGSKYTNGSTRETTTTTSTAANSTSPIYSQPAVANLLKSTTKPMSLLKDKGKKPRPQSVLGRSTPQTSRASSMHSSRSVTTPPPPLPVTTHTTPVASTAKNRPTSVSDLVDSMDPDSLFEPYDLFAEGESGEMFRSKEIATGMEVAIKVIPRSSDRMAVIHNELLILKANSHPHIVEYRSCHLFDDSLYIVYEYMGVGSLTDLVECYPDQCMSEALMARVCIDVLSGLEYLHTHMRVHRDIRSDNLLINDQGLVKITDFGMAAQLSPEMPTQVIVVGTPFWMSPEISKGLPHDMKSDIWSFGIVAVEMAQGKPPYMDYPVLKALFLIASAGRPEWDEPERWTEEFKDFVSQCTQIDASARPTAAQLKSHSFLRCAATHEDLLEFARQAASL